MHEELTPRERQVLVGLMAGRRYRQIGAELGLRRDSVKILASRVYSKLEIEDGQVGLIRHAIANHWIPGVDRGLQWNPRQGWLLNQLLKGRAQKELAWELGVSDAAIRESLERMRRRARVRTTAELLRVAVEQELAAA